VLRPHADAAAFTRQATVLAARYPVGNIRSPHLAPTTYAAARRSIRPEGGRAGDLRRATGLIALAIIGQR
jgi:hypothetical protein